MSCRCHECRRFRARVWRIILASLALFWSVVITLAIGAYLG